MLPHLTAVHLHKVVLSGRNKPVILGCVDAAGNEAGDYVVKLSGAMETSIRGPASELIASSLAGHFGIPRPHPAAIRLDPDLMKWLSAKRTDLAKTIRSSTGLNFGTQLLTDVATWPIGRALPEAMMINAAHIFAFDALIANDDRRRDNPNVLVRGDDIFVIDHELAFAFLYSVGAQEPAWELRRRRSLQQHVFFFQLRKQQIDLGIFAKRLAAISERELQNMIELVPTEWWHDDLGRVSAHLQAVRDHSTEFERQLLEALA